MLPLSETFERTYVKKYIRVGTLIDYEYDVPVDENDGAHKRGGGGGDGGSNRVWDKERQRFVADSGAEGWSLSAFFGWLLDLVVCLIRGLLTAVGASQKEHLEQTLKEL